VNRAWFWATAVGCTTAEKMCYRAPAMPLFQEWRGAMIDRVAIMTKQYSSRLWESIQQPQVTSASAK